MKSMGLPCKHLFHRRLEMGLMLFDASLIKDRWTLNYYRALSVPRFSKDHTPEEENNLNDCKKNQVDVIEEKTSQNVSSQAKKFKKALQLSQEIASLASEQGMKIFQERYTVLQEVLKIWKLGKTVSISCLNDDNNTLESYPIKDTENLKEFNRVKNEHLDFIEQDEISNVNTSDEKKVQQCTFSNKTETEKKMEKLNLSSTTEEEASIEPASEKETLSTSISSPDNIKAEERFTKIKTPPRMKKRRRPKGAELIVIGLPSSKKTKRNNLTNMIVQLIKLKSAEKDKILLECVLSTSTANNALKGVLVTKEKLKSDLNTISDLVRDEKYVELHRIEKYFEDSAWAETLPQAKKFKMVLFGFSKNSFHGY